MYNSELPTAIKRRVVNRSEASANVYKFYTRSNCSESLLARIQELSYNFVNNVTTCGDTNLFGTSKDLDTQISYSFSPSELSRQSPQSMSDCMHAHSSCSCDIVVRCQDDYIEQQTGWVTIIWVINALLKECELLGVK